jgi:hypothetical protein
MIQGRVWKKRSAGLTDKLWEQTKSWLNPGTTHRQEMANTLIGKRRAGVKRRRD